MRIIRKTSIKILGIQKHLSIISRLYVLMTKRGFFKQKYPELFFLHSIVKHGNVCIDIGANLGYYSTKMSVLVGEQGKVYAVEPVPMFYNIWKKNVKVSGESNLVLLPFALGAEECKIKMGMPEINGLAHHGMTKIANSANEHYVSYFDVEMKIPDELFKDLDRVDFIKCDIEGYENIAFSNMKNTLTKFTPIIQSELGGNENRKKVIDLMESLGYKTYVLHFNRLSPATDEIKQNHKSDFYFLQPKHDWLLK